MLSEGCYTTDGLNSCDRNGLEQINHVLLHVSQETGFDFSETSTMIGNENSYIVYPKTIITNDRE